MNKALSTKHTFLAVLLIGLFAMTARNITDPDVWWHLKTGQYIAEHKSVPHTDPFSYTRAGQPWVAHEWLSELLLYELESTTGFGGLIVVFSAVLCAAFFLLYLRCGPAPFVAGVATLCAAWATAPVWGVRPQVLSLLLTSLWLLILDRSEHDPRLLWWTLPLTLLWVNLHAGFAMGLALSALFLAGELVERGLEGSKQSAPRWRFAALILLLDLVIVPLNPNGMRMFSYPVETLRSAAMQNLHCRMGLAQLPSCRVLAFPAGCAGYVRNTQLVSPRGAPARLASPTGQPVRGPLFDPHDAVVRFDRSPARLPAARGVARKPFPAVASAAGICAVAQRRDRVGNGSLCRLPHRPCDPAPAAG